MEGGNIEIDEAEVHVSRQNKHRFNRATVS